MVRIIDQAVCIGTRDYSESSQIVTLFGRATGKLRAIAKGSRRARSNFAGGIDLLATGGIVFVQARGESTLATLCEFHLDEPFTAGAGDLLGLNCAQYAASLVAAFGEELDPHPTLYDAFCAALGRWQGHDRPDRTLLEFELVLLQQVGLMCLWKSCVCCGQGLPARERLYFSSDRGGMLCESCEPGLSEKRSVEAAAWALLGAPETIESGAAEAVLGAHQLLCYHFCQLLRGEPAVMTFVNQLLSREARTERKE